MFTTILFLCFRRTCCLYLHSSTTLHGVTCQKTIMIIIFAMRTSSVISMLFIHKLFFVGSVKYHSVKMCGGVEVQLYIFVNFSLHGSVILHASPLYCQRKSPRYQFSTRKCGPVNPSGHGGKRKSLPCHNRTPIQCLLATCHYSDWAIQIINLLT
jgi:hypothetical protein